MDQKDFDAFEKNLLHVFAGEVKVVDQIGLICGSLDDPEAVEETAVFLGKRREEVTPELWGKRFTAVSFFSDFAFFYFVPSIVRCSLANPLKTHLAVEGILISLLPVASDLLVDCYRRRWKQFNSAQLEFLGCWIKNFDVELSSFFGKDELDAAVEVLTQYAIEAKQLEDRLCLGE